MARKRQRSQPRRDATLRPAGHHRRRGWRTIRSSQGSGRRCARRTGSRGCPAAPVTLMKGTFGASLARWPGTGAGRSDFLTYSRGGSAGAQAADLRFQFWPRSPVRQEVATSGETGPAPTRLCHLVRDIETSIDAHAALRDPRPAGAPRIAGWPRPWPPHSRVAPALRRRATRSLAARRRAPPPQEPRPAAPPPAMRARVAPGKPADPRRR